MLRFLCAGCFMLTGLTVAVAETFESSVGEISVEPVVSGLEIPWAFGFLPDGQVLITEREGRLLLWQNGTLSEVMGAPQVFASGQGGLLDVMVPSDFAETQEIYLTFANPGNWRRAGTAVAKGILDLDARELTSVEVIFDMNSPTQGGRHFGSRIIEGGDGYLYVTIGDRGDADLAQDLSRHNGSIIRIARDGSVPVDNPFLGERGALPEIWSYGHRNPQGIAMDDSGQIWAVEHGARGGDEVNRIERGANYGWPVIAYGTHYSGLSIGDGTHADGMEQPAHYWDPSIAPSGFMIYSGDLWPEWAGDFFIGSLKFDYIARLDPDAGFAEEELRSPQMGRVRDIREAPDGSIWFMSVNDGVIYRMIPAD